MPSTWNDSFSLHEMAWNILHHLYMHVWKIKCFGHCAPQSAIQCKSAREETTTIMRMKNDVRVILCSKSRGRGRRRMQKQTSTKAKCKSEFWLEGDRSLSSSSMVAKFAKIHVRDQSAKCCWAHFQVHGIMSLLLVYFSLGSLFVLLNAFFFATKLFAAKFSNKWNTMNNKWQEKEKLFIGFFIFFYFFPEFFFSRHFLLHLVTGCEYKEQNATRNSFSGKIFRLHWNKQVDIARNVWVQQKATETRIKS